MQGVILGLCLVRCFEDYKYIYIYIYLQTDSDMLLCGTCPCYKTGCIVVVLSDKLVSLEPGCACLSLLLYTFHHTCSTLVAFSTSGEQVVAVVALRLVAAWFRRLERDATFRANEAALQNPLSLTPVNRL